MFKFLARSIDRRLVAHSLTHSLTHSLARSLTHSLTHSQAHRTTQAKDVGFRTRSSALNKHSKPHRITLLSILMSATFIKLRQQKKLNIIKVQDFGRCRSCCDAPRLSRRRLHGSLPLADKSDVLHFAVPGDPEEQRGAWKWELIHSFVRG